MVDWTVSSQGRSTTGPTTKLEVRWDGRTPMCVTILERFRQDIDVDGGFFVSVGWGVSPSGVWRRNDPSGLTITVRYQDGRSLEGVVKVTTVTTERVP